MDMFCNAVTHTCLHNCTVSVPVKMLSKVTLALLPIAKCLREAANSYRGIIMIVKVIKCTCLISIILLTRNWTTFCKSLFFKLNIIVLCSLNKLVMKILLTQANAETLALYKF